MARPELSVVLLPERDGPGIPLCPSLAVWAHIESRYGPVGDLVVAYKSGRPHLSFYHELLYKCARAAGHGEDFETFGRRLYGLGVLRMMAVVGELIKDLFKDIDEAPSTEPGTESSGPLA